MATVTLTIGQGELEKIIAKAIELEYDRHVAKVTVNVEQGYEDRPCGGSFPRFRDVTVVLGEKLPQQRGGPHDR